MKSFARPSFWRAYHGLDSIVRKDARQAYKLFESYPEHASFRFNKLSLRKIFGLLGFQQNIAPLVAGIVKKSIGFGLGRTMISIICLDRCGARGMVHLRLHSQI